MVDCTLLLVVDEKHLGELNIVAPTWFLCHQEVCKMPILILYDVDSLSLEHSGFKEFEETVSRYCSHSNITYKEWPCEGVSWDSHREKMLLAYVWGPMYVDTPWFLKIDTDAIATKKTDSFIKAEWFEGDPAFISNPRYRISFTLKQLPHLEAWASGIESLKGLPTPDYKALKLAGKPIKVCSWFMFGNCRWFQWVAMNCPKMPVPSQDSFHSYVAMKSGSKWAPVNFSKLGWDHKISKRVEVSPLLKKCPGIVKKYSKVEGLLHV